jgi:hypothetical protein
MKDLAKLAEDVAFDAFTSRVKHITLDGKAAWQRGVSQNLVMAQPKPEELNIIHDGLVQANLAGRVEGQKHVIDRLKKISVDMRAATKSLKKKGKKKEVTLTASKLDDIILDLMMENLEKALTDATSEFSLAK